MAKVDIFFIGTSRFVFEAEFIVSKKNQAFALVFQSAAKAGIGVGEWNSRGLERSKVKSCVCLYEIYAAWQVFISYRKVGRFHQALADKFFRMPLISGVVVKIYAGFRLKNKWEKRKAHDMIPVGMGDENINFKDVIFKQGVT